MLPLSRVPSTLASVPSAVCHVPVSLTGPNGLLNEKGANEGFRGLGSRKEIESFLYYRS